MKNIIFKTILVIALIFDFYMILKIIKGYFYDDYEDKLVFFICSCLILTAFILIYYAFKNFNDKEINKYYVIYSSKGLIENGLIRSHKEAIANKRYSDYMGYSIEMFDDNDKYNKRLKEFFK